MSLKPGRFTFAAQLLLIVLIMPLAACHKSAKPSTRVFSSPDEAGDALLAAAKSGDQNELLAIFGPDSKELISLWRSGAGQKRHPGIRDRVRGDAPLAQGWRMVPRSSWLGLTIFPFRSRLKKNADGQWFFDTAAGKEEVLNRRIGRNELAIIEVCGAVADAQAEYFSQPHDGDRTKQYAAKFISDPGKQNGLYWKSADGQPASPLGPLAALATAEGYSANPQGHTAFHGYYFRMLKGQTDKAPGGAKDYIVNGKMTGGFAFVAYPAEYGNSGVMTFMINQDGVLLQKDLGKNTTQTATAMTEFDPDSTWTIVEE